MNIIKKLKATLQLRRAVQMADNAHASSGARYYVMPNGIDSGNLIVMDRANFRKLKQKRWIPREMSVQNLLANCFYYTPDKNETGEMTYREQKYRRDNFFRWLDRCAQIRRAKQKAKKKERLKSSPPAVMLVAAVLLVTLGMLG